MVQHIESTLEMKAEDSSTPMPERDDLLAALADGWWGPGDTVPNEGLYRCLRCHASRSLLPGDWAPGCDGDTSVWVYYSQR